MECVTIYIISIIFLIIGFIYQHLFQKQQRDIIRRRIEQRRLMER